MASFDYRLNPLYAIKECSSCGALYTADFCCSKGGLEDKILVPKPPQNCATCGDPVDGLYCRSCAFVRKCLNEGWYTIHDKNEILNTSESSNHNTNVGPHETFQCQPMNEDYYHEQNSCYDPNSFGFDQFQPPQYTVNHPIFNAQDSLFNAQNEFLNSQNKLMEQMTSICDMVGQIMQKKEEEKQIAEEQATKDRYWKIPICYDDDEDYTIAITPVLSTKEPVDSLIIEDEHLDTIPATESDEVIKSTFEEHSETIVDSNNDSTSSDDDYPYGEDIDYVDASPPDAEIVSLEVVESVIPEVGGVDTDILLTVKDDILREKLLNVYLLIANIEALKDNPVPSFDFFIKSPFTFPNSFLEETNTFDNSLTESETFRFNLEEISSGSTTTRSDYSLLDYEAFYLNDDHIEEKSSGSTTTHADFSQYDLFIFDLSINPFPPTDRSDFYHEEFVDELAHIISPLEYDCFYFKNESELGDFTMDVVGDIYLRREPRVHVPNVLPTHPTLDLDLDFILLNEPLFTYIVWIFLPFLAYHIAPPYLLSCGNEDTIFDPGISVYHRSGTFMKFIVYLNHLNESPMEIVSSTCSPMDKLIRGREVIEDGDSWVSVSQTSQGNGITVTKMFTPATLTFSQYSDAKSMFAAIETRFGVCAASHSVHTASSQVCTVSVAVMLVYALWFEVQWVLECSTSGPRANSCEDDLEAMDMKWQLSVRYNNPQFS
ncbi:hypothetical protein Tco_1310866 [Tanacetum coccineum]